MRISILTSLCILILLLPGSALQGEIAMKSPQELQQTATHIVVGEIIAIYSRQAKEGPYNYTIYIAEIKVGAVEKGAKVETDTPLYVRYWTRFKKIVTPDTNGHRPLPKQGDRVRVYLARDAHDGFGDGQKDGGFNVIGPNGFEQISKSSD